MGWEEDRRRNHDMMRQQNTDAAARRAAQSEANRVAGHESFMATQQRLGNQLRARDAAWSTEASSRSSMASGSYSGSGGAKSKGGSGALLLVIVVIVVIAIANNGSKSPKSTIPVPIDGTSAAPRSTGSSPALAELAPPQNHAVADTSTGGPASAEASPETGADASPTSVSQPPAETSGTAPSSPAITANTVSPQVGSRPALRSPSTLSVEPIYRPAAAYPAAALQARPQGVVIVEVGVQTNGAVISATADSGNPLLIPAALDAARHWIFQPYPFEPGAAVRTARLQFSFVPPANYTVPRPGRGFYTTPPGRGFGPQ